MTFDEVINFLRGYRKIDNIKVGDIYWDCAYHPVYCTESDGDNVAGVSLIDGSRPRSCSIFHCGIIRLNADQVEALIKTKSYIQMAELAQEEGLAETRDSAYNEFRRRIDASGVFPVRP